MDISYKISYHCTAIKGTSNPGGFSPLSPFSTPLWPCHLQRCFPWYLLDLLMLALQSLSQELPCRDKCVITTVQADMKEYKLFAYSSFQNESTWSKVVRCGKGKKKSLKREQVQVAPTTASAHTTEAQARATDIIPKTVEVCDCSRFKENMGHHEKHHLCCHTK